MTEQGIELAAKINLDLTAQIEQLDRMQDKVNDTESTLKKAQKNIKYFIKALECDKCMIGMLGLILLALVAVIVLAVKKNKGSWSFHSTTCDCLSKMKRFVFQAINSE